MVAYSFKPRFVPLILSRAKTHTLRKERKRHARPGEEIQLFTGMRTRSCQRLGTGICRGVLPIRLDFDHRRVEFTTSGHAITTPDDTDGFAVHDGFQGWRDMAAFWAKEHPTVTVWQGVMIQWGDSFQPAEIEEGP